MVLFHLLAWWFIDFSWQILFFLSSVLYIGLEPDGCAANVYRRNLITDVSNDMSLLKCCPLKKSVTFLEEPKPTLFKNSRMVFLHKPSRLSPFELCQILQRPSQNLTKLFTIFTGNQTRSFKNYIRFLTEKTFKALTSRTVPENSKRFFGTIFITSIVRNIFVGDALLYNKYEISFICIWICIITVRFLLLYFIWYISISVIIEFIYRDDSGVCLPHAVSKCSITNFSTRKK